MESSSLQGLGVEDAGDEIQLASPSDPQEDEDRKRKKAEEETVPDNVPQVLKHKWRDEHFRIAKAMSQESADWLKKRSMTLHIRSLHAYVVHAGLLPWTIPKNKGKKKTVHTQEDRQDSEDSEDVNTDFVADIDFSNEFGITPRDTSLRVIKRNKLYTSHFSRRGNSRCK
jgi:hypothetical protein